MDDQRKTQLEQRMVLGLVVIFGVSIFRTVFAGRGARASPLLPQPIAAPLVKQGNEQQETRLGATTKTHANTHPAVSKPHVDNESSRDPLASLLPKLVTTPATTKPSKPVPTVVKAPSLVVSGLIWGGARPQAIVNGKVYDVGDEVQGARILEITREGLTVKTAGKTFTFHPGATRQRMASTPRRGAESQGR